MAAETSSDSQTRVVASNSAVLDVEAKLTMAEAADAPVSAREAESENQVMTAKHYPTFLAPGFILWKRQAPTMSSLDHDVSPSSPTSESRVLVVLFTWLFCTPPNAARYVHLYTSRGWDVLQIFSQLSHFLWPPNSKSFALDIARVLKEKFNDYTHIVVHAMSIGAYNYTTCLMSASEQPDLQKYFFSKLRAVVFDSLTLGTLNHMVRGIATGVSRWRVVQSATVSLANLYFLLTHKTTVQAFNEGVEFFRSNPALVPTLLFGCKNDPMCEVKSLDTIIQAWDSKTSFPFSFRVWDRSVHCAHLLYHSEEYQRRLNEFLLSVELLPPPRGQCGDGQSSNILVSKL